MTEIKLELNGKNHGAFNLYEDGVLTGEMVISISGHTLTVYHTEVDREGKGFARQLLDNMVAYVRKNGLMVIPLCPYVHAQFQHHPEAYMDIWQKPD